MRYCWRNVIEKVFFIDKRDIARMVYGAQIERMNSRYVWGTNDCAGGSRVKGCPSRTIVAEVVDIPRILDPQYSGVAGGGTSDLVGITDADTWTRVRPNASERRAGRNVRRKVVDPIGRRSAYSCVPCIIGNADRAGVSMRRASYAGSASHTYSGTTRIGRA